MKIKKITKIVILIDIVLFIVVGVLFFLGMKIKNNHSPKTVVEAFLTAYKNKDADAIYYLEPTVDESGMQYKGFQGLLAEQVEYEVKDVKKRDSKTSIVYVDLTNVDFRSVFEDTLADLPGDATEEDILTLLEQKLSDENCQKKSFDIEVLVKMNEEDAYEIIMTEDLSNALFGGYNEYLSELVANMMEE